VDSSGKPANYSDDAKAVTTESYVSKDYIELEREKLWPKVWQMTCREEEIPKAGDFYTYDILHDSIIVTRKEDGSIGAYFNACPHRGRRLTEGCGRTGKLHCKFHGWQFNLEGKPLEVVDREDWNGALQDSEISLNAVKVATWGGWVFINMDPNSEGLEEFLAPAKSILDPFEFHRMGYKWRKQTKVKCNWKTALEAFDEAYHVQTTHAQLLPFHDDVTTSRAYGKHGMFTMAPGGIFGLPAPRISNNAPPHERGDIREGLYGFNVELIETLNASTTIDILNASKRLLDLPKETPIQDVFIALDAYHREELAKRGAVMPPMTYEQQAEGGIDWHIFPNMVFLPSPTNLLGYRARPDGDDPNACIFDIYCLERLAEGAQAEKVELEVAPDWREVDLGLILNQDFQNMEEVQRGMNVRGFKGAKPNPVKERAIINFHATLADYIGR
jgi:nitrite reductase/ring-hydroxylating ferredoxin subunit